MNLIQTIVLLEICIDLLIVEICIDLQGKRRTINFNNTGFGDIRLSNPGEESGLEDWESFVCIELARSIQPVDLQPGQEWRAAQQLVNPSK